jgi:RNA polymerase sigma factor (sigma-70 family)
MEEDTRIGGPEGRFPVTRWTVIEGVKSDDPGERERALETLAATYWKPVYKHLRVRWRRSNEDAKDLTQDFFTQLVEKRYLDSYDSAKARLRTFLRTCVDRHVQNADRADRRLKRGGDAELLNIDFADVEEELARKGLEVETGPEDLFEQEMIRSLFGLAVDDLKQECEARGKAVHFQIFEAYDLEDSGDDRGPTYGDLAATYEIAVTDVANHLGWARREFRRLVIERLREMTGSEDEFRREARSILGVETA